MVRYTALITDIFLLLAACAPLVEVAVPNPVEAAVDQALTSMPPQNEMPCNDDLESYQVGALPPLAAPDCYRVWGDCDGRTDYAFVVETVGPAGKTEKAAGSQW
jgi:hypothetical protein